MSVHIVQTQKQIKEALLFCYSGSRTVATRGLTNTRQENTHSPESMCATKTSQGETQTLREWQSGLVDRMRFERQALPALDPTCKH